MTYVEPDDAGFRVVDTEDPGCYHWCREKRTADHAAPRLRESAKLRGEGYSEVEILYLTDENFDGWSREEILEFIG